MKTVNLNDVERLLYETFPNATISKDIEELKLDDFEEWDSLGNFNLLLAFEEFYEIRFTMEEMAEIKSVAQILNVLEHKQ